MEKQMLLIYCYFTISQNDIIITDVQLKDNYLHIWVNANDEKQLLPSPKQRYVVIMIDKLDIEGFCIY